MWKLGLRLRYSFSGNICFEFLAFFLCSVQCTAHTVYIGIEASSWLATASQPPLVLTSQHSSASLLQSGGGVLKAILEIRVRVFFSYVVSARTCLLPPCTNTKENFANSISANCHNCGRSGNLTNVISQLICDLRTRSFFVMSVVSWLGGHNFVLRT
jgi:hypothetical protein